MSSTPLSPTLFDRLAGLVAWLAERIAGSGSPAGGDHARHEQTGAHRAALEPAHVGTLIARLRALLVRFRAVAGSPIPPAKPARKPPEPRFVPTHNFRVASTDPPPARPGPPRSWRWLLRLVPQVAAGRAQLEELLREPAMQAMLAADPRLGRILRPLGWMLGVERALLPASRWRRRPVILVPGTRAQAAQAAADYAAARANSVSMADLLALGCIPPAGGRDRRPVWRGCAGLVPKGGAKIPA